MSQRFLVGALPPPVTAGPTKAKPLFNFIPSDLLKHLLVEESPSKPRGAVVRQRAFSAYLYLLSLSLALHVIQDRGLISLIPLFLVVKAQCAIEGDSLLGQSFLSSVVTMNTSVRRGRLMKKCCIFLCVYICCFFWVHMYIYGETNALK